MARFVPPLDPATLTNNGERAVATALAAQLPNSVTVYHGYLLLERFRSHTGREFFREGEIDFVIFDRLRGILVLEVKGGTISYDPDRGYRREETGEFIRSPFEQARDNMHALMDRIREQPEFAGERLSFVRGYAVVLQHCNWAGTLPADGWKTGSEPSQERTLIGSSRRPVTTCCWTPSIMYAELNSALTILLPSTLPSPWPSISVQIRSNKAAERCMMGTPRSVSSSSSPRRLRNTPHPVGYNTPPRFASHFPESFPQPTCFFA
jgi:hypothetical protein